MKKNNNFITYILFFTIFSIAFYSLLKKNKESFTENILSTKEKEDTKEEKKEEKEKEDTKEEKEDNDKQYTRNKPKKKISKDDIEMNDKYIEKISKINPNDLDILLSHLKPDQIKKRFTLVRENISELTPKQKNMIQPQLDVIDKYMQ